MAKSSMVNRDIKRAKTVKKYAAKRAELKKIIANPKSSYEDRAEAQTKLQKLPRDANPDLMDAHLTNGRSRSIPVVIVYDERFREIGWWGPRPEEIQAWILSEGLAMPSPERYKVVRRWYAKDRGRTTLAELLRVLGRAA